MNAMRRLLQHGQRGSVPALPVRTVCSGGATSSSRLQCSNLRHERRTSLQAAPKQASESSSLFKYDLEGKEPQSIYEHPELYEAAFSFRDMKQEVKFLKDLFKKHAGGKALQSVLEIGCGPASHSIGLAASGVPKVVGLDISEAMLKYARWKVQSKPSVAAAVELVQGDMSSFDLQGRQFDMIMCLLGTFSHMLDNKQALSCFQRVAHHLPSGGIMVLELAHPGDLFDGTYIIGDSGKEVWEASLDKAHKVLVEWGAEFDNFDPVTQILHRTVALNIMKGDEVQSSLEEVIQQRQFTVQEVMMLASMSGLEVQELYGEMSLQVDLSHEEAYRMIAVLKKP